MKKYLILTFLAFRIFSVKAQINLVPNPSFEDEFSCNYTTLLLEDYIYNWYGGKGYFNSCISIVLNVPDNIIGHQYPRTGNAYCGIYTRFKLAPNREYIQVKLNDTLQANGKYRVSFYVSLGDTLHANCNSIGAYFSPDSFFVSNEGLIEQIPQIQNSENNDLRSKTDWTLVCDTFIANGNERYMSIGNFYTDSLSIFTPLDSVCSTPGGFGCSAYYYIDDVSVTLIDETGIEEKRQNEFSLFPNPAKGVINITGTEAINEIEVFDTQGRLMQRIISIASLNYQLSTINYQNGVYLLKLTTKYGVVNKRVVVIN
jgi:hypothetical protein